MINILIVSALEAELKIVKQEIKKLDLKNIKTSFFATGVGNYNMILNLTKYLENNDFDLIINIGVCGYKPHTNPLLSGEGLEQFIQIGRIKNLSNDKELIIPNIIDFGNLESIFCSETPVYKFPLLDKEGDRGWFDMESYGFELVCDSSRLARIILKVPVDKIGDETKNFDTSKAKKYLSENIDYKLLFEKIEEYLESTSPQPFPVKDREQEVKNKILSHYKFSVSEKIILEKLINKFIVLELGDINKFFKENKSLDKKEFLKKLEG